MQVNWWLGNELEWRLSISLSLSLPLCQCVRKCIGNKEPKFGGFAQEDENLPKMCAQFVVHEFELYFGKAKSIAKYHTFLPALKAHNWQLTTHSSQLTTSN